MNLLSTVLSKKFLYPVLIILLLVFLYSLWERKPDVDDAWIGVDAYTLAMDGYAHTELMRGINQQEELFVVGHKLFNLHGALFIKLFGFSLNTLKAVSLLYFLIFICLFYLYTVRWKKLFDPDDLLFAMILIIVYPYIFKYSFVYRPEITMMTFGFAGFILLENYLEEKTHKLWRLFLSGIFFGLTMATHLNGAILVGAAFSLLLWNRKWVAVPVYGFGALLAFLIYFYDFTGLAYFDLWRHQFFDAPYLDSLTIGPVWMKPVFNFLQEHIRYFHNPRIIFFSLFMFLTIITGFKYLFRNYTNLMRFAILIATITGVVAMHKAVYYLLLNFPYFVILITLTFKALKDGKISKFVIGKPASIKTLAFFLFFLFLIVSTFYNVKLALDKFSADQNRKIAELYAGGKEKEMNIVAPMTFMFDEIENFNRIQGDLCYYELQKLDASIKGKGFFEKAESFDIDLIMISNYYVDKLKIEEYKPGDTIGNFAAIDVNDELTVFKRIEFEK